MAAAGADVIVAHMGYTTCIKVYWFSMLCMSFRLTTSGSIGATTALTLEECVPLIQGNHHHTFLPLLCLFYSPTTVACLDITDVAKEINKDVIVLCHGGPISMPTDAEYVLKRTRGVDGYVWLRP